MEAAWTKSTVRGAIGLLLAALIALPTLQAQDQRESLGLQFGSDDSPANAWPDTGYVVLDRYTVEGNRKSRRPYVLRELTLQPGDTVQLEQLAATLDRQRELLLNTGLYSAVALVVGKLDVHFRQFNVRIVVREKWYFYPSLGVDLADRNFNVWWNEQNRSLDRVNLKATLRHANVTGRRDRLTFGVQAGYTRRVELSYQVPFVDRAQRVGIDLNVLLDRSREWGVRTEDGLLDFFRSDTSDVLRRQSFRLGITVRPGVFLTHLLRFEYQRNRTAELVASELNPNFFGAGRREQNFTGFFYEASYDSRDVRSFPIQGSRARLRINKLGLGRSDDLNRLTVSLLLARYQPLPARWSATLAAKGKIDVERTQVPYFNREVLGFDDDFVRGYQLYVVDGLDYGFVKSALRYKAFDQTLKFSWIPVRALQQVPLRVYVGGHADVGAARDPFQTEGNSLANQTLYGYGIGLYAVGYYSKVAQLELTRNGLGDWGLFLSYGFGL